MTPDQTDPVSPVRSAETAADECLEIALTRDERVFLRHMIETWEDTLHPTHLLRVQRNQRRTIRYAPDIENTRVFLTAAPHSPPSPVRRWWRDLRARAARVFD